MNPGKAYQAVDDVIRWIDEWNRLTKGGPLLQVGARHQPQELWDMIRGRLPLIARIADALEPKHAPHAFPEATDKENPWWFVRQRAVSFRGMLADAELTEAIFDPGGPQLAAKQMHQWVWSAAERRWATGHYREALQAAATAVEAQVQAKTVRYDLSGADLLRKVFSLEDPHPDDPRLRLEYPSGGLSWKSAHEGAANFGSGCMMAIRNIVSHNLATPDEAQALQQHASLSVLDAWVDQSRLVEVAAA